MLSNTKISMCLSRPIIITILSSFQIIGILGKMTMATYWREGKDMMTGVKIGIILNIILVIISGKLNG